jgi:hypothetical protein
MTVFATTTALCAAAITFAGIAPPTFAASHDPLFSSQVAITKHAAARPGSLNVNFTVNFEGSTFVFPGALKMKKHQLSGTVIAPSGCVGTVNAGSTDLRRQLNLAVTFGDACAGEPGTFVGTLKFKAGTGTGTFTDPFASGPYVASHG